MPIPRRRQTPSVQVGPLALGSRHPIAVQSMTNTLTSDIAGTVAQAEELIKAGAELVRFTVNDDKAAAAVPSIVSTLRDKGHLIPFIGDFHFNGHLLLRDHPQTAKALDKYRINPGNIGRGKHHDENFDTFVKIAIDQNKPVRIGVNGGSLDPELIAQSMNQNAKRKNPRPAENVILEASVKSAIQSAEAARKLGLAKNKIVLSVKMSRVQDLIAANTLLAGQCDYVLHVGLTEAGSGLRGMTASASALGVLLQQGIGDTIRVSLTPEPGVSRAREVEVCRAVLQSLGLRCFHPEIISCPGCGRTNREDFGRLAFEITQHIHNHLPQWKKKFPGVERLTIAVMGCVVNGPGESRHADVGISLPGVSEKPQAPVYVEGKKAAILKGENICGEFIALLEKYLEKRFKGGRR